MQVKPLLTRHLGLKLFKEVVARDQRVSRSAFVIMIIMITKHVVGLLGCLNRLSIFIYYVFSCVTVLLEYLAQFYLIRFRVFSI